MADLTLLGQGQEALRLLDARQPLQAEAICRRILASFPKHVESYAILGRVMAQTSRHEEALDLFRRVLGADPESLDAYIQMASLYERWGQTQEALWHWQRAFELMPGNQEVRAGLQRLLPKAGLATANPFKLTRAALARVYLRGQLYQQAIRELSELASAEPQRHDLRAALVEALERGGLTEAAAVAAQSLLDELPYCLKANLVLGRIWLNTAKDDEARALLQRAQMLDPENRVAHSLFGARSPLPLRIPRLPLIESDTEPIELPYLVDDEEIVAESMIIDAQAEPVEAEETEDWAEPTSGGAEPAAERRPPAPEEHGHVVEAQRSAGEQATSPMNSASEDTADEVASMGIPEKMSLIDVQRQYLAEHPDDCQARLDLARRLRDMGQLDQAAAQYQACIEGGYEVLPAVMRDLELLARLYPGTQSIDDALRNASERERRVPPASQ